MLRQMPHLLLSTATALASWELHRNAQDPDVDRSISEPARSEASLAFVHFAGFWSHYAPDFGCSSWTLPECKRVENIADFAEEQGGIVASPLAGDVFLLASARGDRHVLAGIISVVEQVSSMLNGSLTFICTTIEGELGATGDDGAAPCVPTARVVRRRLSAAFGDCFIRWCDLAARTSRPAVEYMEPKNLVTIDRASTANSGRRAA
ncbi:MAG TPA: hypothetical protein VGH98_01825 [Gemmatimonadaceae bacterium]|jgi:hypothetical protein